MSKEQLIEAIEAAIKTNGQHDITGSSLQAILVEMVNTIYDAMPSPYVEPKYNGVEGSLIIQGQKGEGVATEYAILEVGDNNEPVLTIDDGESKSLVRLRGEDKSLYDIYVKSDGSVAAELYNK